MTEEEKKKKIIDRLKKVQALAERGEEGEAENAARMLGKMLEKHRMSMFDLDTGDEPEDTIEKRSSTIAGGKTWERQLAFAVFDYFDCRFAYRRKSKGYDTKDVIVGYSEDIECGEYLFHIAKRQIEDSTTRARANGEVFGRSAINVYRISMVWGFKEKLKELKAEINADNMEYGLMVLDRKKQVDLWVSQNESWGKGVPVRVSVNSEAHQRGRDIRISKGVYGKKQKRLG